MGMFAKKMKKEEKRNSEDEERIEEERRTDRQDSTITDPCTTTNDSSCTRARDEMTDPGTKVHESAPGDVVWRHVLTITDARFSSDPGSTHPSSNTNRPGPVLLAGESAPGQKPSTNDARSADSWTPDCLETLLDEIYKSERESMLCQAPLIFQEGEQRGTWRARRTAATSPPSEEPTDRLVSGHEKEEDLEENMETMSMMEMEEVCWRCEDKSFLCLEKHLDTRLASLNILEEIMGVVVQERYS